jgi:hypothetical protein
MEQLSGNSRQGDSSIESGSSGEPSTNNQVDTGCSSVAIACKDLSSKSSDRSRGTSDVRRMSLSHSIQNAPASPSMSSTSSRDGSEGITDTERPNEGDATGSKKDTTRLRKGKWTVRRFLD